LTCIAVRDGVIAADSQVTGDYVFGTGKLVARNDAIVGFCGVLSQAMVFVDWYFNRKSRKPSLEHECGWEALVLKRDGSIEWWDNSLRPLSLQGFHAIGSGCQFAMGAMEAGCTAAKAVEVACARDPYCNLPVTTMTFQTSKKTSARKRPRKKR
jgi:ATP-dependent protease HslVU (ClpYQ) peptidase subunit